MKKILFLLIFVCSAHVVFSQENESDPIKIIIDLAEEIAASGDDEDVDFDFDQLYAQYADLLENPINLNTATRADLEKLYILSDFQISSIIDYIATNGAMFSIYELALVVGFDDQLAQSIYPFVTVSSEQQTRADTAKFKDLLSRGKHQIIARARQVLQEQEGYKSTASTQYDGSPLALYARYNYAYANRLKWNFTTEKDAGEKYMDFYSAHIQYDSKKFLQRLVVGDFQAQFGQGLVVWNGFSLGKPTSGAQVRKRAKGVYGYSSTDENRYFRGVAATFKYKKLNFSVFASYKNRDANILDSTLNKTFVSLQNTGLHRTPSEIANKNSVGETAFGGNINYSYKTLKVGATAMFHKFNADYIRDVKPYNIFELSSSSNSSYSVDAQWSWRRVFLFGEAAMSQNRKLATLLGASFNMEENIQFSILYRNYARDYQSLYAQGFGENTTTANEEGFYACIAFAPIKKLHVAAYFDIFRFPWLKYRINAPSNGYSYSAKADYLFSKNVKMYVLFKQKTNKENYTPEGAHIAQVVDKRKFNARFNISYVLLKLLQMQSRIEYTTFKKADDNETGYMIFQDVAYDVTNFPLNVSARYAYFHTDGWNSRIYSYESDMLYAFSIPAYYSIGSRFYFNIKYSITKKINFWLRFSHTIYNGKNSIGSGLSKIEGNKQSEIKVQVQIKL